MRRLLQPSYECFGMHLGRFELVPVPVAPSRLPVPLALSTRRPTAVDIFTGGGKKGFFMPLVQVSSASIQTTRIDEILVSNSNLLSGLSEASGVKLSWVEVSQESLKNFKASLEGEKKVLLCLWCKFRVQVFKLLG